MILSDKLQAAVSAWVASPADQKKRQKVLTLLDDPQVQSLSYLEKNRSWLTAHKLLKLDNDPYLFKIEYIDEVPPPVAQDKEALITGLAVDNLVTAGDEAFSQKYIAVPRRDKKNEEANPGKTLLTNSQMETIRNAAQEFGTRHFFPREIRKRNLIAIFHGLPLKAELDGFSEELHRPQDLKTTANLNSFIDDFRPGKRFYDQYIFQLSTYAFIYELSEGERVDSCELLVCDKYEWSRSHKWIISYDTLRAQFPRIEQLIQDYKLYQESSIWPFTLRLDTPEGLKKFNDSVYYSHPLLKSFKDSIPPTVL